MLPVLSPGAIFWRNLCALSAARSLPPQCRDRKNHASTARTGTDLMYGCDRHTLNVHVGSPYGFLPGADDAPADESDLLIPTHTVAAAADLSLLSVYRGAYSRVFWGAREMK